MRVPELWSSRDQEDLDAFLTASLDADLMRALFAVEGCSPSVMASDRRLLGEWAARVRERLSAPVRLAVGSVRPSEQVAALERVLGDEAGFRGDTDDYHDPRNSLIHQVVSRRRGMPILLSAVWMDVGRRAGISVAGIGMPGHFIIRVGGTSGALADPFAGGTRLSVDDCRKRVGELSGGRLEWQDEFLRESRVDEVLERALQNLLNSYQGAGDGAGAFRAATFLASLRPDSPERQLKRAEIAEELGARELATQGYEEVIETFPETPESETAWERLEKSEPNSWVN